MLKYVEMVPSAHHPCLTTGTIVSASHLGPRDGRTHLDGGVRADGLTKAQSLELRTLEVSWQLFLKHEAVAVGLLGMNFPSQYELPLPIIISPS